MKYTVYLTTGEQEQADVQVESLGNGFDKYTLYVNGVKAQAGIVNAGKVEKTIKKYFARRPSVECVFRDK